MNQHMRFMLIGIVIACFKLKYHTRNHQIRNECERLMHINRTVNRSADTKTTHRIKYVSNYVRASIEWKRAYLTRCSFIIDSCQYWRSCNCMFNSLWKTVCYTEWALHSHVCVLDIELAHAHIVCVDAFLFFFFLNAHSTFIDLFHFYFWTLGYNQHNIDETKYGFMVTTTATKLCASRAFSCSLISICYRLILSTIWISLSPSTRQFPLCSLLSARIALQFKSMFISFNSIAYFHLPYPFQLICRCCGFFSSFYFNMAHTETAIKIPDWEQNFHRNSTIFTLRKS